MSSPTYSGYERIGEVGEQKDNDEDGDNLESYESRSYYCAILVLIMILVVPVYLFYPAPSRNLARECMNANYHSSIKITLPLHPVSTYYVPLLATHTLEETHARVKYAVIAIHGYGRRGGTIVYACLSTQIYNYSLQEQLFVKYLLPLRSTTIRL